MNAGDHTESSRRARRMSIDAVVREAEEAFFARLAEVTGARTGDLPPDASAAFSLAARFAADAWLDRNAPCFCSSSEAVLCPSCGSLEVVDVGVAWHASSQDSVDGVDEPALLAEYQCKCCALSFWMPE